MDYEITFQERRSIFNLSIGKVFPCFPILSIGGFVSCFSADIWAACVTLYVLIKGHFPFPLDNIEGHILNMSTYNAIPDLSGFSPELTDLLTRCFSPNINNRLTIKEILVTEHLCVYHRITLGLVIILLLWMSRVVVKMFTLVTHPCILRPSLPPSLQDGLVLTWWSLKWVRSFIFIIANYR